MGESRQQRDVALWRQSSKEDYRLGIVIVLSSCLASIACFARCPSDEAFFFTTCIILVCLVLLYGLRLLGQLCVRRGWGGYERLRMIGGLIFLSAAIAVLLEALTIFGTPQASLFVASSWSKRRLVVFFFIAMCLLIGTAWLRLRNKHESLRLAKDAQSTNVLSRHGAFSVALWTVSLCFIAVFATGAWEWHFRAVIQRCALLVSCVLIGAVILFILRAILHKHVEYAFLVIGLVFGIFLSFALPPSTFVCWDDETHFNATLGISYLKNSAFSSSEKELIAAPWVNLDPLYIDYEKMEHEMRRLDADYSAAENGSGDVIRVHGVAAPLLNGGPSFGTSTFGRIPSAVGLWVARLLGLSLSHQLVVGRLFNMLFYVVVLTNAVRIVPGRKKLMGCIGLLPTGLFMASGFSYDPTFNVMMLLAIAETLREFTRKGEPLAAIDIGRCVVPLLIALCIKAIYFPLIVLLLFMPKERFASKRCQRLYYLFVMTFALYVVASFALPMILPQPGAHSDGDMRGGAAVSTSGQIAYILNNPGDFVGTIATYVFSHVLSINWVRDATLYFAYPTVNMFHVMPSGISVVTNLSIVPTVTLGALTAFDLDDTHRLQLPLSSRIWIVIFSLVATGLSIVALYISFTAVGADYVAGWQARYGLVTLFPLLMVIELPIRLRYEKAIQSICVIASAALLAICCTLYVVVYW